MEDKTISFFIPIEPKALPRHRCAVRNGRAFVYPTKTQKEYAETLTVALKPFAPEKPLRGPLGVVMTAWLPIPKSWTKEQRKAAIVGAFLPISKPDIDNAVKQIFDRMTEAGFWEDDCQVVHVDAGKLYSETPGWEVKIAYQGKLND